MAILIPRGMELREEGTTEGTARTDPSCSLRGTGPTWRFLRYVDVPDHAHWGSVRADCNQQELIWTNAQYIAMRYPFSERWRYREAARTLRIPYWDWTINPAMPDLTNTPWITINAPGGPSNVSNPLFEYAFHPQPPGTDFPPGDYVSATLLVFPKSKKTKRWGLMEPHRLPYIPRHLFSFF